MLENETAGAWGEEWRPPAEHQAVELLVGIPAYNEEVGIGSTVVRAREHADCVVVVDDGSTDRTAETAQSAGAVLLRHGTNRGKGAAIDTLLQFARDVDCRVLVLLDGDGQHVPADIPDVAAPVLDGDADLVIGNRHHEHAGESDIPRYRRVGQYALDRLTCLTTGADVTDTQTGFRALAPDAIDAVSPSTNGMGVESEMLHAAVRHDLRIDEVPIDVRYDGIDGQTHNPVAHGLQVGIRLLTLLPARTLVALAGAGLALAAVVTRRLRSRSRSGPEPESAGRWGGTPRPSSTLALVLAAVLGAAVAAVLAVLGANWRASE